MRVVTVWAGVTAHSLRATRRAAGRLVDCRPAEARRTSALLACAFLTIAGRGCGFSAMWTAPPPSTAPPQVHAHNFAKAILTDISTTFVLRASGRRDQGDDPHRPARCAVGDAKEWLKRKRVNHESAANQAFAAPILQLCPRWKQAVRRGEGRSGTGLAEQTGSRMAPLPSRAHDHDRSSSLLHARTRRKATIDTQNSEYIQAASEILVLVYARSYRRAWGTVSTFTQQ